MEHPNQLEIKEFVQDLKSRKKDKDEPVWKQRQREWESEQRKRKLWLYLGGGAGIIVVLLLLYFSIRGMLPREQTKKEKLEPRSAIAHVIGTTTDTIGGKKVELIGFTVGTRVAQRPVKPKDRSLKPGELVVLTYTEDPRAGTQDVLDWQPYRPDQASGPKP